jgi:hypothetical protein
MKTTRGNYPGASEFAQFDTPVHAMTREQMQALLECILHRASPGEENAEILRHELEIAEMNAQLSTL